MARSDKEIVIQAGQLQHLLATNLRATLTNSFLALVLAYLLSDVLPQLVIFSWAASMLLLNIIRSFISQYYLKHPVDDPNAVNRRLNITRAGIILSSVVWAFSVVLIPGEGYSEHELFVAYIFMGLSAGAAMAYSIDLVSALAFLLVAVVPLMVKFNFGDDMISLAIAVTGYFYVIFMALSVKASNVSLTEGVVLRVEAIKNAEEIKELAFYDSLTGLPNRRLLSDRLIRSFFSNRRAGKRGALLYMDLDNFKVLNDTLGHDMGDMLLTQVAQRLKNSVRESDTVSRYGGDEFVVILEGLDKEYQLALQEVDKITKHILSNLGQPYQLDHAEHISTPSIGVALYGEHGKTPDELIKNADIAMYRAKESGRNTVCIYDNNVI